ncbi:thaumatin [Vararia minispora EC-137]|uniref:Thaumatin n=1 Tax=Vararia minispora EC-137 TaxID=1314806 RepID=A0ACB8QGF1_9AGAM|nr:thaumatin [Vararia minispora EC-137]
MMKQSIVFLTPFVTLATVVTADRTITVRNQCSSTIWPALFTDPNAGSAVPSQATGWEMASGTSVSFTVSNNWTAGRVWPRTGCDFSTSQDASSCATGGCSGGLECTDGTAAAPVTLAEFTLSSSLSDFYDVSLVNGFNVPVGITNTIGCAVSNCPVNLNANCPAKLQKKDATGNVVGSDSPSCCTGSFSTAATCPATGVPDYAFFKNNCPNSVVFPYDNSGGVPLLVCPGSQGADYIITFCP